MIFNENNIKLATGFCSTKNFSAQNISIDSRNIVAGDIFIALSSGKINGHHYVNDAYKRGASLLIIEKQYYKISYQNYPLLIVNNTAKTLRDLGKYARERFSRTIVGITGSVGKTTTKDMLAFLLSNTHNTVATMGNFNNQLGVPISLSKLNKDTEIGIFELGMNNPGEILLLGSLLKPNIAIITEISNAHSISFKSLDDIAKAKAELIKVLTPYDTLILNRNSNYFEFLRSIALKQRIKQIYSFGYLEGDFQVIEALPLDNFKTKVRVIINHKEYKYILNTLARHNIILSCLCLGTIHILGLNPVNYLEYLAKFIIPKGRGKMDQLVLANNIVIDIIDDSYNASPVAMMSAILTLDKVKNKKKIIILGDMLELANPKDEHLQLAKVIKTAKIDIFLAVGENMGLLFDELGYEGAKFQHYQDLIKELPQYLQNNVIILIKGSNSLQLYEVVNYLNKLKIN